VTGYARPGVMAGVAARFGGGSSGPRDPSAGPAAAPVLPERLVATRALGVVLDVLRRRRAPVVLDLGRVVGGNLDYFAAEFGGKVAVADLFADLDARAAAGRGPFEAEGEAAAWMEARAGHDAGSVDAVICWDTLEYLTAAEARVLAPRLARLLRPHGVLALSFSGEWRSGSGYDTCAIVDRETLRRRFRPGPSKQLRVLTSREVMETFRELALVDTFLLPTRTYEMVFRKPPSHERSGR